MNKKPLDQELVREYIIAAHGNFIEVKRLIEQEPALIHAAINWNMDDWESGLGAASHTGNRDIAEWLLEQGARMDIFAAAMLGELSIVKGIIDAQPSALHAKGPHGISLIRHAEMGGKPAEPVLNYLQTLLSKEAIK
ncbi:ankyrin repeat domain-containing protein [Virgibacillus halodenitrificans]|uniref:Ankyrin repeat domain-containing protein n=1 Tax=Virgibacillus halodenitrificans TaxID=1482 RepID=A0ABR7VQC3_VIRHA|nr:ankyrin repeat domain-containing protein [Virgibacillus halodenitrificans]MBD1224110.1 ankyrin repeat domain-containing protein [Virgibacillus halodenitrificans]MYL58861.1 ankyrin repeat domain-containing protein [Virgibacillus halodenitrificans]